MSQTFLDEYGLRYFSNKKELIWTHIQQFDEFTVDDLHEIPIVSTSKEKRFLGQILAELKREDKIRPLYYVKSTRRVCHHRPVLMWKVIK